MLIRKVQSRYIQVIEPSLFVTDDRYLIVHLFAHHVREECVQKIMVLTVMSWALLNCSQGWYRLASMNPCHSDVESVSVSATNEAIKCFGISRRRDSKSASGLAPRSITIEPG